MLQKFLESKDCAAPKLRNVPTRPVSLCAATLRIATLFYEDSMTRKPFQTTPEQADRITRLTNHFQKKEDGAEISWVDLERDLDIPMRPTSPGRALARRALKKLKREYEVMQGYGIKLSSSQSAIPIMQHHTQKITRAVRRAGKVNNNLSERHLVQMSTHDRDVMVRAACFFATLEMMSKENSGKLLSAKKK
jgi:hypothetical protein